MSAILEAINQRQSRAANLARDAILVISGSLFVALFAQLFVKLPFTPVPITGQTFAVLIVGAERRNHVERRTLDGRGP